MILQKEISAIAKDKGVVNSTIDKDWVLGHFIDAIYSIPELKEKLIFKGGTCLKKCYFQDYRFSEDLDFTAIDPEFVMTAALIERVAARVTDQAQILTHVVSLKELVFKDQCTGYEAVVKFWGADHPRNQQPPAAERWMTSVKIEIILYEKMIFPIAHKPLYHPYSDQLQFQKADIPCYSIPEVISEKLRALIQRSYSAPRDYYDIWYLSKHYPELNFKEIVDGFFEKMAFKNLEFKGVDSMINADVDKILKRSWKNSLAHQIPGHQYPEYDLVRSELLDLFNQIFSD